MKTTTNSMGETSWTVAKADGARGTRAFTFTRRNGSDAMEVVEAFYPSRRGIIEHGFCGALPVVDARAKFATLRAEGYR